MNIDFLSSQFYAPTIEGWMKLAKTRYNEDNFEDAVKIYALLLDTTRDKNVRRVCYTNIYHILSFDCEIKFMQRRYSLVGCPTFKIPLTMTTCKRYSLFKRTVDAFFTRVSDSYCIDSIYIFDDGSTDEDVNRMKADLDALEIDYHITQKRGGHGNSMNMIVDKIKQLGAPFFVHLEDDFEVRLGAPIISQTMEILLTHSKFSQCLFNNSYREYAADVEKLPLGKRQFTKNGLIFYEHVWKDDAANPSYAYWPGFSLTPGLNRLDAFEDIGPFIESGIFEKEYAIRSYRNGWRTAYLETVYLEHIGRKISERGDPDKPNAYDLNGTTQFGQLEMSIIDWPGDNVRDHISIWQRLSLDFKTNQVYYITLEQTSNVLHTYNNLSATFEPWDVISNSNRSYIIHFNGANLLLKLVNTDMDSVLRDVFTKGILIEVFS